MTDDQAKLVMEKLRQVPKELEVLGLCGSMFLRCPNGAKEPLVMLLIGSSHDDVNIARETSRQS